MFDVFLLVMVLAFGTTALVLIKNRFYDRYYARIHKHYLNLVAHHLVDEDEAVPPPDVLERKIVRDVIIDLLFITKGSGVQTLRRLYERLGLYRDDIALLKHRAWHERLGAVDRLDQWKSPDLHRDLVILIEDENPDVRIHALKALALTTDALLAEKILRHLLRTRIDLSIRYECLSRLLRNHRSLILNRLCDPDWSELHPPIIKVLGDQRDIQSTSAVLSAAAGKNPSVRESAYVALGKIGDPRGISVLLEGLGSSFPGERLAALRSVHQIDEELFRKHAEVLGRDPDPLVRGWTQYLSKQAGA